MRLCETQYAQAESELFTDIFQVLAISSSNIWLLWLFKKLWRFHKNTRSFFENECCCPRTVNISNVNYVKNMNTKDSL